MNKLFLLGVVAFVLVGCGKPVPIESVESLVANPARLKELRAQCKTNHANPKHLHHVHPRQLP